MGAFQVYLVTLIAMLRLMLRIAGLDEDEDVRKILDLPAPAQPQTTWRIVEETLDGSVSSWGTYDTRAAADEALAALRSAYGPVKRFVCVEYGPPPPSLPSPRQIVAASHDERAAWLRQQERRKLAAERDAGKPQAQWTYPADRASAPRPAPWKSVDGWEYPAK